jgi:hypothetical protein
VEVKKWKNKLNWLEDPEQKQKGAKALRIQKAISYHPFSSARTLRPALLMTSELKRPKISYKRILLTNRKIGK